MGRAATVNGNGHAVLPPVLVDDVIEAMRRYTPPPPPPRSIRTTLAHVFGWLLLALLVVAAGLGGGLYLYGHETLSAIAPRSKPVIKAVQDLKTPTASEPAIGLLIGYDARAGSDGFDAAGSRSDTIMLVRADPQTKTLSLLSFPRDLQAQIYCDPTTPLGIERINSAWSTCTKSNARGTLDTVEKLTGLSVNYLITVDFHGFKLLVNKVHGVYMQVDHRYINTVTGPAGYAKIDLKPGYQLLDGQQALDYVRFRHTDSDLYRNARQQLFLEALKDRLSTSVSIFGLPQIIGALKQNIEIGRGSGGSVGFSEIEAYAGLAYGLGSGHLFRVTIPNLYSCGFQLAQICASPTDIQSAVSSFEHPDVTINQRATDIALGHKPKEAKQPPLKPAEITTLVLNGTLEAGLARDTSYKLAQLGYHTVLLPSQIRADAPTSNYDSTYVYYDAVQPNAKQAAKQVSASFGAHALIAPLPPSIAPYAEQAGNPLTIAVVGKSFGGDLVDPQAHVAPTPVRQTAAVSVDSGSTMSALQAVRTQVPFRILAPHVIASGSRLAYDEPVRVYKPAVGHKALCLTFVTGAGNVYWQIMETDWTSAPILRRPTDHITLSGRRFDLYTTGGTVHMISLRQGKAVYWVTNTLRDELSNETMLALAKGLVRLTK